MKAENRQIPQKLAARLKFAHCIIQSCDIFWQSFVGFAIKTCRKTSMPVDSCVSQAENSYSDDGKVSSRRRNGPSFKAERIRPSSKPW